MAEKTSASVPVSKPVPAVSGPLASLEAWLYDMLVVKAPFQLPKGFTDFLVSFGPWITLVVGILLLPAILAVFTIGSLVGVAGSAYYATAVGPSYWLSILMLVVQVVIMFISVPMLLKRKRNGWLLLFYADLLSFVYGVVNGFSYNNFPLTSIVTSLISLVIGLYVLFQIRRYYTK
jgi:predicted neutral ceramidase superfamily lipid hydrolase